VRLPDGSESPRLDAFTWWLQDDDGDDENFVELIFFTGERGRLLQPWSATVWSSCLPLSHLRHVSVDSPEYRASAHVLGSLLVAFGLFIQQKLLAATPQQAERHTRKRLAKLGWEAEPIVRVIHLRRRQTQQGAVPRTAQDWSCRWVVRGHWRQQFYPSRQTNHPLWITPYVKGPDEKPLKPTRATVFAVVR
jgi:hypothetical protein